MQTNRSGPFYREEAKRYYRNQENIEKKWLDRYGSVSRDNDYQRNRDCLAEVFNMLDIVMEIVIEDFRKTHRIVSIEIEGKTPVYTFDLTEEERRTPGPGAFEKTVTFSMPGTFARRVTVLRMLGYDLTDDLFYDTRYLRNETAHGNQTIILQNMKIGYEETMKAMQTMSDALIELGKLPESMRSPTFEMMRVREGDTLLGGVYTIGAFLGEGGMSRVYEASQKRSRRRLAVKEFKPGICPEETVRRESEILSGIRHERIPQIYDSFSENGTYYIVMQYIEGTPLDQCVASGKLTSDDMLDITDGICEILGFLYGVENGAVIADLSPSNILADEDKRPYLLDPGVRGEGTAAVRAATPAYCAPEVMAGKPQDERSDIYSLGRILWFLCTGESPALLDRITDDEFERAVPRESFREIISVCTQRNPEDRYETTEQLRRALAEAREIRRKEPGRARPKGVRKVRADGRKGAGRWILAAAVFFAAVIACAVLSSGVFPSKTGNEARPAAQTLQEDHAMNWQDPMLEMEMRRITGIEQGEILLSDVWDLRELSLRGCGIKDITALGELINLEYLDLGANRISDLTPLSGLSALRELILEENEAADPAPLGALTKLEKLEIGNNQIRSLAFLENMKDLSELAIGYNPLKEEEVRAALEGRRFTALNLCGLGLTDGTWLREMDGLTALYLSDNHIADLTPLSGLTQLRRLYLETNGISDLGALSGMVRLEELDLQHNPVGSLAPLSGLTGITWLDVRDCGLTDLAPVSAMKRLTSLDAGQNGISDLSPLSGLVRISYLDVSENALSGDVEPLSGLKALAYLDLRGNRIRDISALKDMRALRRLYLEGNPIEDLSVLESLPLEESAGESGGLSP